MTTHEIDGAKKNLFSQNMTRITKLNLLPTTIILYLCTNEKIHVHVPPESSK